MTVIADIERLFGTRGAEAYYGEPVTQLQHALQTADAARRAGADEALTIAALLHDIGHLLTDSASEWGDAGHDAVAVRWLRERGFSEHVVRLAGGHVAAKRWLVATTPNYLNRLSAASRQTLRLQGGPMSPAEAAEFEADPLMPAMVRLRSWDEMAKDPAADPPPLRVWLPMIERHLAQARASR
jgi:phosphonate degradation associated HDIG domain protein